MGVLKNMGPWELKGLSESHKKDGADALDLHSRENSRVMATACEALKDPAPLQLPSSSSYHPPSAPAIPAVPQQPRRAYL